MKKVMFGLLLALVFCACNERQATEAPSDGDRESDGEAFSEDTDRHEEVERPEADENLDGDGEQEAEGPRIGGPCTPPAWVCVADNMGLTCDAATRTWQGDWCQAKTVDGCEIEGTCGAEGCLRNYQPPGSDCQWFGPSYCDAAHGCVSGAALLGTPCVSGTPRRCYIVKADYFARKILETAVYECGADGVFVASSQPYGPASTDCAGKALECTYQSDTVRLCPCGEGANCAADGDEG